MIGWVSAWVTMCMMGWVTMCMTGWVNAWVTMCMTGWVNAWVTVGWVDEVKPLVERRGTLYLRAAVRRRGQRPPKSLGTDKTGSNIASKHARKHEARLPRVKKKEEFSLD